MVDSKHDKGMEAASESLSEVFKHAFEAYRDAYEAADDIGAEPGGKDDDDPDVPSAGGEIRNPVFRDKKTGRGVRLFHTALGITGAPSDMRSRYGIESMMNLTQGNFLEGSKKIGLPDRTMPTKSAVDRAAARVDTEFCTIDIERWWPADHTGTQPLDDKALDNYRRVSEMFDRAIKDGKSWAWYSTAPQRAWFAPVRGGSTEAKWMAANERAGAITKLADFVAPSLYTFSSLPDKAQWRKYARGNVEEALRISGGKPVLPFLWPFWHVKGTDPIDRERMLDQYETCLDAGASGIVIFLTSGNRKTHFNTAHKDYFGAIEDLIKKRLERI